MKKVISVMALVFCALSINAQILRTEELEDYAKEKYGEKWVDAAENLGSQLKLDKNNALTFTQVIESPGKTKDQLYVLLNYWFSATFNDANSVIQLNDKELGSIIAQGFMSGIAQHAGGMNAYSVNIKPIIKCDIKDNKIRVTYTVPFILLYAMLVVDGLEPSAVVCLHVPMKIGYWMNVSHFQPRKILTKKHPVKPLSCLMLTLML